MLADDKAVGPANAQLATGAEAKVETSLAAIFLKPLSLLIYDLVCIIT
jgi:hypothetical protein